MIPCPKCSRENNDDALYCDQCRTAVSPDVAGSVHKDPCPACGGAVNEVPSVMLMCSDCGMAAGEAEAGAHEESPTIQRKADPASPGPVETPDDGEKAPCPVCGAINAVDAAACGGCHISFGRLRRPVACPKCEAESTNDVCDCGAILTLPKLLGFVDSSVKVVCSVCKQLFTVAREECSDCGGEMHSADGLKAFAASKPR